MMKQSIDDVDIFVINKGWYGRLSGEWCGHLTWKDRTFSGVTWWGMMWTPCMRNYLVGFSFTRVHDMILEKE